MVGISSCVYYYNTSMTIIEERQGPGKASLAGGVITESVPC
jgi:hypothetical protein